MPEVVVDVEHVRQQRLRRPLLKLELLHPIAQHDRFAGDLPTGSTHPQDPR